MGLTGVVRAERGREKKLDSVLSGAILIPGSRWSSLESKQAVGDTVVGTGGFVSQQARRSRKQVEPVMSSSRPTHLQLSSPFTLDPFPSSPFAAVAAAAAAVATAEEDVDVNQQNV